MHTQTENESEKTYKKAFFYAKNSKAVELFQVKIVKSSVFIWNRVGARCHLRWVMVI